MCFCDTTPVCFFVVFDLSCYVAQTLRTGDFSLDFVLCCAVRLGFNCVVLLFDLVENLFDDLFVFFQVLFIQFSSS